MHMAASGGGRCGCDCEHWYANKKHSLNELKALVALVVLLTKIVNIMVVKTGGNNTGEGNSDSPDEEKHANAKNPELTKTEKGENMTADFVCGVYLLQ